MSLVANAKYTAVKRGITRSFELDYRNATPYYPTVCTMAPSGGKDEGYAMLGRVKGMREFIGERQFGQISSAEFTLKNKHWENSLGVERTDVDDDRLGFLRQFVAEMAVEDAHQPDDLVFQLQREGETRECWDGQFFYDTDHLWGESGSQSNIVEYVVSDVANVTPQEVKKAYHKAIIRMLSFKRDNGKPWIRPTVNPLMNMRINSPLPLLENTWMAFNQPIALESNGNDVAATSNVTLSRPTIDYIPQLGSLYGGSDTVMDVHYTGGMVKPFLFQNRQDTRTQTKGGDDIEFKEIKFMSERRNNVGYLGWFFSIRVKFVSA